MTLGQAAPQNTALPNYDLDADSVLGRSLASNLLGLLAGDAGTVLEFTMPTDGLVLNGPSSIKLFAAKNSTLTISPTLRVEVGNCAPGETTCAVVAAAEVSVANHIDEGFETLILDLGTINTTLNAGHLLVVQITAPGLVGMHIGFDAQSHPSSLSLTTL